MRISDWSSDVCSSDLNRICHYSVTPAFTVNGPSSATNLTPPDGVMCKSHQIFASSPASVAASIASIVASGISRSTVLVGTPRSEEHTSELQSLMRISYAVFCLKNNTTYKLIEITKDNNIQQ